MRRCAAAITIAVTCLFAGCAPSSRPTAERGEFGQPELSFEDVRSLAAQMLPAVRRHAEKIASFGPRQTGQRGCWLAYRYVRDIFAALDGDNGTLREFGSTVTVPLDRWIESDSEHSCVEVYGLQDEPVVWDAYSFYPNNVQDCITRRDEEVPRRLVDLGQGRWEDFEGKSLKDAVVLLDYNSADAWLRAKELGAYAAIFYEPDWTNWRQTDLKYLDMVPIYFPRLYISREHGLRLRKALAAGKQVRVVVRSRLRWRNVKAPCVEFTVPGKDRSRTYILVANLDARCIVPDLAYGGDEVWGPAVLLELAKYYATHKPAVNLRFMMVTGHWQAQRCTRDYVAPGSRGFDEIGRSVRLVLGFDYSTERPDLNLIRETSWDDAPPRGYRWLRRALFSVGGWHDEIRAGLRLDERNIGLFAGQRPMMIRTTDDSMATRDWLCPFVYAPKFYTANEAWSSVQATTFAFQTAWLWRLTHNSPLDRFEVSNSDARFANLRPQIEMTLALLDRLTHYPARKMPRMRPTLRRRATWGGYAQLRGRVQVWNPAIGWFSTKLPEAPAGGKDGDKNRKKLRTFVYAVCIDAGYLTKLGGRERLYLAWPLAPSRRQHRELQSFMFRELRLLDEPDFRINGLYARTPSCSVDVVGYALDDEGRILYATDFGVHGDGNPAFQCTDVRVNYWDLFVPVTLFPCGSVELFDLLDIERRSFVEQVFGQWYILYAPPGNDGDRGVHPYVRVTEIKNAKTHTDLRSWGFAQWGRTAMVFLPALTADIVGKTEPQRAEILVGTRLSKFTPLLNTDEEGRSRGYEVRHGQTIRLNEADEPAAAAYVREQFRFDSRRLREFAAHEVSSPLAKKYHSKTAGLLERARQFRAKRSWQRAEAFYQFAWNNESQAYRYTIRLLFDVVSTTVFYFTLLIPFSFLVERLIFPQTNAVKTCLVAAGVFVVFVAILYAFHPGFKLASNVLVTVVAFVIVVMTIPALILLLVRGVGMLKAMGTRAIILQRSEAEKAGVLSAALSLSVSNMRRRKLRTSLTLITITTLVVALVLLTTSAAFEFSLTEPQELAATSFYGIQVYNTGDRRNALLPEMVEVVEAMLRDKALVLRREYVNYGYDPEAANGCLYLEARGRRVAVPYVQFMKPADAQVRYKVRDAEAGQSKWVTLPELMRGPDGGPVWFGENDVNVCLLPNTMAEQLGVRPGDTVRFMGIDLKVLGVWQARVVRKDEQGRVIFDKNGQPVTAPGLLDRLTDLDAQPITPLKFAVVSQGDPDRPLHCASTDMIILPHAFHEAHRILPANVWSLIVIPRKMEQIPEIAAWLSREVKNADVFYHFVDNKGRERLEMISLREATRVRGTGLMAFMTVIAVLMILAIMTGTVYERMREINIFSSVGLAPRHVAGMFLIESLVYAGIASVVGYFIGIVALRYMSQANVLPKDFYPNYLGVYVLYAIGIAMLATVASSLYPIRVASRMVNPSLERTWKIDTEPEGDFWYISLPFIATSLPEAAGMIAYAYEFLSVHQGERTGKFVCQSPPQPKAVDGLPAVEAEIWLAPFERNVTQHAVLRIEAGDRPGRWGFALHLRRLSGPAYLWQRSNRAFVDALRKHLLNWRAMAEPETNLFVEEAKDLFGKVILT